MSHWPILPFLLPFTAAVLLLLLHRAPLAVQRGVSLAAALLGAGASVALLCQAAGGGVQVYALGNWPAPYGIMLVGDRLAALMLVTLYALALPALLSACAGLDACGPWFHPLFQLQLAGLAAAFLTGDMFNLFVAFEILLLASYALLAHGGGKAAIGAGLRYVILNLAGSAMFLIALAILYATLGTLNMADMAVRLREIAPADVPLVRVGLLLLVLVFVLKAALFPLAAWLPATYPAAAPAIACLFAILTKVGIVALLRLDMTALAAMPQGRALLQPWLPLLALATIAYGSVSALAAANLARLGAGLLLISSGTLLFAIANGNVGMISALLFYLPQSTLVTGGFFLLAGAIAIRRGDAADRLIRGPVLRQRTAIGLAFLTLAVAVSGLPPLSGFLGKLMLLQAVDGGQAMLWWPALLGSGLIIALVMARAGSILFWEPEGHADSKAEHEPVGRQRALALALLVLVSPAYAICAAPIAAYADATAQQLIAGTPYASASLGTAPARRDSRPG